MKTEQRKTLLKYGLVIIFFILYTALIPTIGLNQIVKTILDAVIVIVALYTCRDVFKKGWKETKKHPGKTILMILGFWLLSVLVSGLASNTICSLLKIEMPNSNAQIDLWKSAPWYLGFSMLVFSPIIEELVMTVATKKLINNKILYLLISGLFCGIMYVAFSTSTLSYWFIISYFLQEVIWAFAYLKTENSFVPITIHLLQNVMAIIGYMAFAG